MAHREAPRPEQRRSVEHQARVLQVRYRGTRLLRVGRGTGRGADAAREGPRGPVANVEDARSFRKRSVEADVPFLDGLHEHGPPADHVVYRKLTGSSGRSLQPSIIATCQRMVALLDAEQSHEAPLQMHTCRLPGPLGALSPCALDRRAVRPAPFFARLEPLRMAF